MKEVIEILIKLKNEAIEDLERHSQTKEPNKFVLQKLNSNINRLEYIIEILNLYQQTKAINSQEQIKQINKRKEEYEKLIIICLIHGIDDLEQWLKNSYAWLKNELIYRRAGKPTIRNYLIGKKIDPQTEILIQEIEKLESIKTIQIPIAHIVQQWDKTENKTTNKPVTSFKTFIPQWQNQNKNQKEATT